MHGGVYGYTHEDTSSMDDNPINSQWAAWRAFCLLVVIKYNNNNISYILDHFFMPIICKVCTVPARCACALICML